jgi:endonuclease/exonuclease/phosphatase family metal-dependent hydrolase
MISNHQRSLKILNYNIQSGLPSESLSNYLMTSWRHVVPSHTRQQNLQQIANVLGQFDVVALQEVDAGSMRTQFVNQVQYLAHACGFPHWYLQVNRDFGKFAKHSNAVLSRMQAYDVQQHKLPGLIPGRGAMQLLFGNSEEPLVLIMMHLALGPVARNLQLKYIDNLIQGYKHIIIMGDMNCQLEKLINSMLLQKNNLRPVNYFFNTYPSWRPKRNIDHIFVSSTVKINHVEVLKFAYSDHLPIALDVTVPVEM